MARTPCIFGNWKLNHDVKTTRDTVRAILRQLPSGDVDVGIAPVMTTVFAACEEARDKKLHIAGQNVHHADKGAFTGEVSVAHLKELGCTYAIVGHSERRQYFGETDAGVGQKTRAVLDGGLTPIACVGESLEEREGGQMLNVIDRQVGAITAAVDEGQASKLVIAYEPVWAIGTGKTASAAQAQEVHAHIRGRLREAYGDVADQIRIQYGGSVKPDNAKELLSEPDIDGALVGGASLTAESFCKIVDAAV